ITGEVFSSFVNLEGNVVDFESGNYYALVSGADAEEVVGVIVLETGVGQNSGVNVRETSGFILER
ncbi:MAG: hypothetical protein AAGF79_13980, partial [Pseudomonadota bacterium]